MRTQSICLTLAFLLLCPLATAQWLQQSNGLPSPPWGGVAIDASDTNTAVISIGDVFRTVDGGTSWHRLGSLTCVTDFSMVDSSHIWVVRDSALAGGAVDCGIYGTTDAGAHWTEQYYNPAATSFLNYIKMFDLFHGVAMGDPANSASGPPLFAETIDGGTHWVTKNDTLSGDWSGDIWRRLSFVSSDIGYFYASGRTAGLYKTTTGGLSWVQTPYSGPTCDVVSFYDERVGLLIPGLGSTQQVFRTGDGGATWQAFPSPHKTWGEAIAFAPGDPSKVWSADTGRVFFSSDTGRTWTQQLALAGKGWCHGLAFVDSRHGWLLGDNYVYHTSDGGSAGADAVQQSASGKPGPFALEQNYPNPFNPSTTIEFTLPRASQVNLTVYDILGRQAAVLVNERREAGVHEVKFGARLPGGQGSNLASGVYFYRLQAGNFVQTRKFVLLK